MFKSKSRRDRAMGQAEHLVSLGREGGESLRHAAPVARERLEELREQTQGLLHRIEEMREQAQPALDEARRSVEDGKKSAAHGASAIALASEVSRKPSRVRGRLVLVILLIAGGAACLWWKRRAAQADTDYRFEAPPAALSEV